MGVFQVTVNVGNMDGGDFQEVEVLVDTGAIHSVFPDDLLRQLHIAPLAEKPFFYANGEEEVLPLGFAQVRYAGETLPCPVVFSPHGQRLLGATTLEIFNLAVDPARQELIRAPLRGHV